MKNPESHNTVGKRPSFNTKIIPEPRRSQTESKKTISSCQHRDDRDVRVSDKDFKAAIIMLLHYQCFIEQL